MRPPLTAPRRRAPSHPRPRLARAAGAVGLILLGAIVASDRARRDQHAREAGWRDRLHHGVLPSLHAAERALAAGDTRSALVQLQAATHSARATVETPVAGPNPVGDAAAAARRTWGSRLTLDTTGVTAVPHRTPAVVRLALGTITREALNNVARHQPGATAQVVVNVEAARIVLSVTGRGPEDRDTGEHATDASALPHEVALSTVTNGDQPGQAAAACGYGVEAMRRAARDAGGRLEHHLGATVSVVLAVIPRRRWAPTPPGLRRRSAVPR